MLNRLISNDQPRSRWLAAVLTLILLGLAFAPFVFPGVKALSVAAKVLIFVVLVVGFDLLLGYTGIVSFAHTMFFGIGAYGIAISSNTWGASWGAIGWGFVLSLALTLVLSLAIGLFSLRVRAIFFAMITLAVAAAFQTLASQLSDFTGGEDGLSLTERVRAAYPLAGLVVLTARSTLNDKLEAYARGADLYLVKPLEVPELCAAVSAMGRRRQRVDDLLSQLHSFTLSQQRMTLCKTGQTPVHLSAAETTLLVAFSRAPGQRLAYWQTAETLGLDLQTYAKASLEVRIVRLRKKLVVAGAEPSCIEAVRSNGYQLCIPIQVI